MLTLFVCGMDGFKVDYRVNFLCGCSVSWLASCVRVVWVNIHHWLVQALDNFFPKLENVVFYVSISLYNIDLQEYLQIVLC